MSTASATARALLRLMHVGERREAELFADIGEDRQRRVKPEPARAGSAGAVRLVEAGLVDEADAEPAGDLLQRRGHFQGMRAAFQLARAGDQRQRRVLREATRADRARALGRKDWCWFTGAL